MSAGNSLGSIGDLISVIVTVYCWLVVIRILISWFQPNPSAPAVRFMAKLTDPALDATRRIVPLRLGGLDCSPIILLIFLYVLAYLVKISFRYLGLGGPPLGLLGILALGLLQALMMLAWFFFLLMAARVVVSLVNPSPYNPLVMMIMGLTEPLVSPLRGKIPSRGPGGLDLRAVLLCAVLLIFYSVVLGNLGKPVEAWIGQLLSAPKITEPRIW